MWKPLEALADPASYFRDYGIKGTAAKFAAYSVRPLLRLYSRWAAGRERRYYERRARAARANSPSSPKILLHPAPTHPLGLYAISKMCASNGVQIVTSPSEDVCAAIAWEDATHMAPAPVPGVRTLNLGCHDISKTALGQAFEAVFGYGCHVDPESHVGPMVEKSDANGLHDGRIVDGPARAAPARVYQRVIDNSVNRRFVMDIRTPVIGTAIPFVYLKFRYLADRFSNRNTWVVRRPTGDVLKPNEVVKIIALARAMGLDYCELDILRDRSDGRIYIVDVNKTPAGPPNHLARLEGRRAMRELGAAFVAQFLEEPPQAAGPAVP